MRGFERSSPRSLRQRAGVARRHHQVFAALALVGPRQPEVGDEAEVGVIENAQHAGRHLQDHRSVFDVDDPPGIDHDRVRGQEERAGVRQAFGDAEALVGREAAFDKAPSQALDIGRRHAQQEGFHAANEVEVVVDLLDGSLVGQAVVELQGPDAGLHRVGRRDRRRNIGFVFRLGLLLRGGRHARERERMPRGQDSLHHDALLVL